MFRPLVLAAALSVLAVPASVLAVPASVLAVPATQAPYQYRTMPLTNVSPAAVLAALHWNIPNATLPQGVRRIFGLQSGHRLLVEATLDGYGRVETLVAPLDIVALTPKK